MSRPFVRSWFFTAMGLVALFAILVGFGRTYAAPVFRGAFVAPPIVHIHGVLALSWVLLFVAQPLLIRWRGVRIHRAVGLVGLPLAIAVAATMIPVGVHQAVRDVDTEWRNIAVSSLLGVITSAILFAVLVTAGILARRDREAHSRWLLLATLLVIWPAWFRFRHWFPMVPRPELWFGVVLPMAWVVVAIARDQVVRGAVHPVLLFAGSGLIVEQSLELLAFDTPAWRSLAESIFAALK